MMLRDRVAAVVDELKRLKREGVTTIAVSDETLAQLHAAAGREIAVPSPAGSTTTSAVEERRVSPTPAAPAFVGLLDLVKSPAPATPSRPTPVVASASVSAGNAVPSAPIVDLPAGDKRQQWDWLRRRVLECPVCQAHTHGENQVVFGVGNIDADIFFCGEAPGGEEEIKGEPFVGPAGQVLTRMIIAMGLQREDVYIGNILNWRPEMEGRASGRTTQQTGNRPPKEEEMNFCLPYLRAQVAVVQPKVIVALGSTAAQGLLGFGSFKSLGSIRGRWLEYQGTPLMVTYHPSYLLRYADAKTKRMVWEDMLLVMEKAGLPISEKQRGYFT